MRGWGKSGPASLAERKVLLFNGRWKVKNLYNSSLAPVGCSRGNDLRPVYLLILALLVAGSRVSTSYNEPRRYHPVQVPIHMQTGAAGASGGNINSFNFVLLNRTSFLQQ
jgi:hypothetical protein